MQLQELLSVLPFYTVNKSTENIKINGFNMDHREVKQGDVFICIKGFTVDGHQFAEQAVHNGAVVIIAERPLEVESAVIVVVPDTSRALAMLAAKYHHYPTHHFPLIGITGTNGKTTTTYLIEKICQEHRQKTGLIGTIQMKIGNKAFPLKNTTPD